jgi:hypothetical protein
MTDSGCLVDDQTFSSTWGLVCPDNAGYTVMDIDMRHDDEHAGILSLHIGMKVFDTRAFPYTAHILQPMQFSDDSAGHMGMDSEMQHDPPPPISMLQYSLLMVLLTSLTHIHFHTQPTFSGT